MRWRCCPMQAAVCSRDAPSPQAHPTCGCLHHTNGCSPQRVRLGSLRSSRAMPGVTCAITSAGIARLRSRPAAQSSPLSFTSRSCRKNRSESGRHTAVLRPPTSPGRAKPSCWRWPRKHVVNHVAARGLNRNARHSGHAARPPNLNGTRRARHSRARRRRYRSTGWMMRISACTRRARGSERAFPARDRRSRALPRAARACARCQGSVIRNLKPKRPHSGSDSAGTGISVEADTAVTGNVIDKAPRH
jgi:putative cofactor-binding repeat protein